MKQDTENKTKSLIFVLTCVLLWAFIPVVSRFGQSKLDNYQFLFWSSILSLVVLFISSVFAGKYKHFVEYKAVDVAKALGLGFMGSFLYYLLLYFAYAHAKGLEVLTLQYTWPIFIVIFSIIFLKEKLTTKSVVASALGFAGVLVVLTKGNFLDIYLGNMTTNMIVLLAAAVFGLFSVLSKKTNYEPFTATTLFFLSASICSFISMFYFSTFVFPPVSALVPILINGVLINGLSYIFWLKALSHAKASFVAPFVFLTPVLAAVLVILFFHEIFLPVYFVGMGLVVTAGLTSQS